MLAGKSLKTPSSCQLDDEKDANPARNKALS